MIIYSDDEKVRMERLINEIKYNLDQVETGVRYNFTTLIKYHSAKYLELVVELTKFFGVHKMSEQKIARLEDWEKSFVIEQLKQLEKDVIDLRNAIEQGAAHSAHVSSCNISGKVHILDVILGTK
jgi:hypothetical protein